ncbi:MAG: hypothetical protein JNG86_04135 [Verrucomicrobiaceae bacterium]|nr:hypothetical protein [Verrucomicrobiaceae bacterium]
MNALLLSTAFFLVSAYVVRAQPPSGEPQRREGERDRRGPGGPPGMSGGMMRPPDGFEKLTEEEKKTMREAFSKAWSNPDVVAARDKALQANEQVRRVLHEAMKKNDPKVAAILERIKPAYPVDERGFPLMPSPESPEFAKVAMARLDAEARAVSRPGRHEDGQRFHARIMENPRMKEAFEGLQNTVPGERVEAFRKIRELYRQLVGEEFARMNKAREEREGSGDVKKAPPKPPEPPKP